MDHNDDARTTLALALREFGHDVCPVADALEALRVVDHVRPHVAVLDIGRPVMDGYELARRLRSRPGTPIAMVAVTGYGQPEDKARARRGLRGAFRQAGGRCPAGDAGGHAGLATPGANRSGAFPLRQADSPLVLAFKHLLAEPSLNSCAHFVETRGAGA